MNAYELADELLNWTDNSDAANMLRQQADRIAELEKQTKRLEKTDVYSIALESGFMLSTQHGQGENLLMPVTDGNTLMALVRAIEERHGIK